HGGEDGGCEKSLSLQSARPPGAHRSSPTTGRGADGQRTDDSCPRENRCEPRPGDSRQRSSDQSVRGRDPSTQKRTTTSAGKSVRSALITNLLGHSTWREIPNEPRDHQRGRRWVPCERTRHPNPEEGMIWHCIACTISSNM